ncbi:arginase [Paenibacillus thalictri]|uniref:Arginase n=1 Tax=Paenibacillus thalictri TaxID=2527873 RepID=A0A4Q9DXL4_9BACL|nr:arginase [Paenibacillus thalictri]TBL81877.1 arginase [Paenibacillus thalictri]
MNANISILGVPMDLGADRRGVDMGPSAIRCAGLEERLRSLGYQVRDLGDIAVRRTHLKSGGSEANLKYLSEIVRVNTRLCSMVAGEAAKGRFPLVIGGDHSIAIGTLAGVSSAARRTGVIWYDAHGDVNTAETSPSGNIHGMSLAASLGFGHPALTQLGGHAPKIRRGDAVLIGVRSLDPGERIFLKEQGVTVYTMHDIDRIGIAEAMEQAIAIVSRGTDRVHLSLDLDGLDPSEAPGVGTPVPGGVSLRESLLAMEILSDAGILTSAEFVEVNPTLDVVNRTAKAAVELIASLLGERII